VRSSKNGGRRERALLGESEVQRLLLAASERAPTGVRNRALVALLYCAGLRLEEALRLAVDDVELERGAVRVRGRCARSAHLFPAARPYLEAWLALRGHLGLAARAPLFCTLDGGALAPAYVRAMLARLARRAGLSTRVHAHGLRHAFAARAAGAGLGTAALAEQLGQRSARSAARALAAHGVSARRSGSASIAALPWSLAPEPGAVRVLLRLGSPRPVVEPRAALPAQGVLVRRWRPEEL